MMPRIVTVTLNAAIDKTYYVPSIETGSVMRVPRLYAAAGGKGTNVARVARQLGEPAFVTGFAAGCNGAFIRQELGREGIPHDLVEVLGESRICLNIVEQSGRSTELLEAGPTVNGLDLERIASKVADLARNATVVVLSGSLPKGAPNGTYAELIRIIRKEGASALLDTSGEPLREGLQAAPDFIKPNQHEAKALLGIEPEGDEDWISRLAELETAGVGCAAVTLGAGGAIAVHNGQAYRVAIPHIDAVNTVGCGDAFVAGMAVGMIRGERVENCLRTAAAAGAANALTPRAGEVRLPDFRRLYGEIIVERMS